jgi:class 3 adenylate cyclase/pimeloyl-ACP methyl ester carboxylesterase
MEPRIQYAKTSDGVSIAFWTLGEGPPFVSMGDAPYSHIRLEWHTPEIRSWYENLSRGRMLVRFDQRGGGLSDRTVSEFSLEAFQLDLAAVVDRLRLEKFALFAPFESGPVAIAYAARNPERVSHLILWCTHARGSDYASLPQIQALRALVDRDWSLYTETLAHVVLGWSAGDPARRAAELIREAYTRENLRKIYATVRQFDVSEYLPQVRVPTLVLHRRLDWFPDDASRLLTSRIPDARLVILDGASARPFLGNWEAVLEMIEDFLQESGQPTSGPEEGPPSGMTAILFADIANSTALTERFGDAAFREKARELDAALRTSIRDNAGTSIEGKLLGDGVLAVFTSARQAIEAALACGRAGDDAGLPLHLGIHAGDVIREENNVYGGAVNIASRICALSAPGEILVSDTVRGLARTSAGVAFEDRGEQSLKGVGEPVRVYEVSWRTVH